MKEVGELWRGMNVERAVRIHGPEVRHSVTVSKNESWASCNAPIHRSFAISLVTVLIFYCEHQIATRSPACVRDLVRSSVIELQRHHSLMP